MALIQITDKARKHNSEAWRIITERFGEPFEDKDLLRPPANDGEGWWRTYYVEIPEMKPEQYVSRIGLDIDGNLILE